MSETKEHGSCWRCGRTLPANQTECEDGCQAEPTANQDKDQLVDEVTKHALQIVAHIQRSGADGMSVRFPSPTGNTFFLHLSKVIHDGTAKPLQDLAAALLKLAAQKKTSGQMTMKTPNGIWQVQVKRLDPK